MNEIELIRRAKNVTRDAAIGLYAISIVATFIFVQFEYPDEAINYIISNFIAASIAMLIAHILLQFIYRSKKDQIKKTVKEPEEIDEEFDT